LYFYTESVNVTFKVAIIVIQQFFFFREGRYYTAKCSYIWK